MKSGIARYRKLRGYTQEFMSEKLGITISAYSLYENGKRNIPKEIAEMIIEILEIPPNEVDEIFLPKTFAICKNII